MSAETYTDRHLEVGTVAKMDAGSVTGSHGWSCSPPKAVLRQLAVGDEYGTETRGGPFGTISGFYAHGRWLSRKSDQQMEQDRAAMLEGFARTRREELAANRRQWTARDEALPQWLHERMATFHERGGENFRLEGWGYELVVAELAALYADNGCEDTPQINAYAAEHGTSGNQHGCAKALARAHLKGDSLRDTVAALSPITGNAFYTETP